ncbi:MAG: tetratricopeptide repeat protein [Candidatus Peribacteraceae bacterium]|nr:tetratricopeptide repeat protein [Candidatus Peribacteraceae bacterium]
MNKYLLRTFSSGAAPSAAPFLVCALLLLSGCGSPFVAIFIDESEQGLSDRTKTAILTMQENLLDDPDNAETAFSLARQYLQAVRESADTAYYQRVDGLLSFVETAQPDNPEVDFLRGQILMGRHDFGHALPIGQTLVAEYPQDQRYYGLLTDAQIEMGRYGDAVATLQTMSDLKPDNAVLTRIAYLREIHGDFAGAIDVMRQAAGVPSGIPEQDAWTLSEIGRLLLPTDPALAKLRYAEALSIYPDSAPALAGLAKIAAFEKDFVTAQRQAETAFTMFGLPEYSALLGDIHSLMGNTEKADLYYALTDAGYEAIAKTGTNVDLERGKFLADHGRNLPLALELGKKVYGVHPTIYAADLLSFASLKNDLPQDAWAHAQAALATGTKDPVILTHAALAAEAAGKTAQARQYRQDAAKRPHFSLLPISR